MASYLLCEPSSRKRPHVFRTRFRALYALLFLSGTLPSQSIAAQDNMSWKPFTTLGYGGLGGIVGYLAAAEAARQEPGSDVEPIPIVAGVLGGIAGGSLGLRLGRQVDTLLADGETVPTGKRRGVQLGTILTGATAGTLLSLVPANARDDGRDRVMAIGALSGATVGLITQIFLNHHLDPHGRPPRLSLSLQPTGAISLSAVYRF